MSNTMIKSLIPEEWDVPRRFRARLGRDAGRQRAMIEDGHLLLILHEPPQAGASTRRAKLFWRATDGTWRATGSAATGLQPLKRLVQDYGEAVASCAERLDRAEGATDYFELIQTLGPLARGARNLHKVLQEARDAAGDDRELITLRDRAYELERDAELAQNDAQHGLEFTIAKRAEEQAEASRNIAAATHRLNLISAMCLPLTAIASAFGTNIKHGFENADPLFFWLFVGLAMTIGLWLRGRLMAAVTGSARA